MQHELLERLDALARTPLLMVACDYDGTLAEITAHPEQAFPHETALRTLHSITSLAWTTTAVVSGRSLSDLALFLGDTSPTYAVGSHGAEWQHAGVVLTETERHLLRHVTGLVSKIAEDDNGLLCELKPAGVALHVRNASPRAAAIAITSAIERCGSLPGVHVRHGSQVIEFMVVGANKGDAVRRARHAAGATGVLFIGDDLTDEDVFRTMSADDVSIKVGGGDTTARHRIMSVPEVAEILEHVAARRERWTKTRSIISLETCAILSDQRTAAVVSPGAKLSWLCMPRLDSAAIFAELVGDSSAGAFEISPVEAEQPPLASYDGDSFVLTTEWPGLRVIDYLDTSSGRAFQKAGRADLLRVIEGTRPARVRFAPRLDYGRIPTHLRVRDDGLEI